MASVTRSTRRAEGLVHRARDGSRDGSRAHAPRPYHHDGRQKRGLDAAERDLEALRPKRSRIAVEFLAKGPPADEAAAQKLPRMARLQPPVGTGPHQAQQGFHADPSPAGGHQAVIDAGHGLDRLPPLAREQGRKLRSQEATRFKSELSAYFPDYDEVIGNDPKEQHLFTLETPIVVVDSNPRRTVPEPHRPGAAPEPDQPDGDAADFPARGYGDALFTDVLDVQCIDFRFLETQQTSNNFQDPLPDGLFELIHRRAKRLERSIRNSEKGRAQHEKDQIIRLLEGLQGHDWLRVMGVSGITETRKRSFEPARDHFIKGCQAILDKFRNWSVAEKRRKQEKERALAEQAAKEKRADGQGEDGGHEQKQAHEAEQEPGRGTRVGSEGASTCPDDSSASPSPAQQLRLEAMARSRMARTGSRRPRPPARLPPPKPPEPRDEFRSFFSKRHERDGALNRNRRAGRRLLAWGHPVPEMAETDFVLPEDYRDGDTLKSRERRKRRDNRGRRQ